MSYANEHTLQQLLSKVYHRLDMDDTVTDLEVRRAYKAAVGDFISRLTTDVRYAKGTLTVRVVAAGLRNELFLNRTRLADRINEVLGRPAVKRIILK